MRWYNGFLLLLTVVLVNDGGGSGGSGFAIDAAYNPFKVI